MLVLGIDPGTAITGYGLVREHPDGRLQAVEYGVIRTAARLEMPQRLLEIHRRVTALIQLHRPTQAAVELLFFQKNVTTAMTVGQARGVVLLACAQAGLPVAEYTPMVIKEAVAGYGGADKRQVQQMMRALLGLEAVPQPDDAADALAVAICHLHSYRLKKLSEG